MLDTRLSIIVHRKDNWAASAICLSRRSAIIDEVEGAVWGSDPHELMRVA
ncbi:MAG: hypothetical protein H0W39_02840 [Sphingomonas sp.]|nr:hypothetical protein [Sphingomonas sp.]